MDILTLQILSLTFYKLASLIVGTLLCYFGYRLFMAGIWGHAGELEGQFKDNKLVIRKAAPGSFFVVAGVLVIAFSLIKGLTYEIQQPPLLDTKPILSH